MDRRRELWRAGEDAAARFYEGHGGTVLARNARIGRGEIDLIVRLGRTIVFCEVKTRGTDRWGSPAESVHPRKRLQVRGLASQWLSATRPGHGDIRFDVVSVIVRDGRTTVTHIPDAF